ncbi:methionyl-tRNA formyltransferase [Diaphorobacter aerolatus]|uniref:Methionyl-tRNA formyltransferase n=1 Tax=Diaphorobacter aerolatus TaxID=1288495 RepID=A0A7H0GGR2_9BURK|nr:methionyl-tRNA formyltransferase [Diaphorobacter aerolatus]QNP47478.1 methionyl-tRNA formyltransferase [Diaphorobacter aerolatus]
MKIVFAGTPEFAAVALRRLIAAGFEIPLVLTQPDRPAGRGMKLQASPVKQSALERGIPVSQPRSLRLDGKYPEDARAAHEALLASGADCMIVAAYGLILPQWVLDLPRLGCLNIHASLLPRWRGAAPIHRAIEAGDAQTGVTIMQMDAGLDTGDMLLGESLAISARDTTATLHDKLAELGGRLIVEALEIAACGQLVPVQQPEEGVTYAHKIEKAESAIDWTEAAPVIARRVRAFDPFPAASTMLHGETVKIWAAEPAPDFPADSAAQAQSRASVQNSIPGQILNISGDGIDVACGDHTVLRLTTLQRAGGKRLAFADFLRGFPLNVGDIFQSDRQPA